MSPKTTAPPRPKLDRTVVVDAAFEVADGEGLDAVTIRRLAQDLSVTPMALYWHFKDKDALLAAVADRVWTETAEVLDGLMATREASGDDHDGSAQLRLTLEALITVMRRHPAVAVLAPSRVVECEPGLAVTERTLAFLVGQGFGPDRAAELARFVLCSAVMLVSTQPGAEIAEAGERDEVQRRKRIALASLPPDRYPNVVASAEYLTACDDADSYFAMSVELVVAGVRHQAPAPAPASARRRARKKP